MEVVGPDPKAQLKAVSAELKVMNPSRLFDAVDVLSVSLVMGVERYLRKFDSSAAIPLLADVCETFIQDKTQGDLLVITLRALSLVMEHVPSSYEAAQPLHATLMQLSSTAIHLAMCNEWKFGQSNNASMVEEGLRVMRFISKDDVTGELFQHALVGDLLTLCTDPAPLIARQALETLLMMTGKVVMPSEVEKLTHSVAAGIFSFFKSKKSSARGGKNGAKARSAAAEDIVPHADHPIVVQVENVIAPLLVSLVEQYARLLASNPERWCLLDLSLQCLGTLIERALICHRPHTARTLASPVLPRILFQLMISTESNVTLEPSVRFERVLLCETTLTLLTSCRRNLMLESLQLPEGRQFLQLILEDASDEITSLLDDPFPRAVIATRSTQRRDKDHITSIAALQLLVLACPTVPSDAFGLKPKLVLPVHQWMWEDELRHNNNLAEEQCVCLETSWARLEHRTHISVHLKQLAADLRTMTLSKGSRGGHRNISRTYVPFVYHFADESALRPIVAVKEAGPSAVDGTTLVWNPSTSGNSKTNGSSAVVTPARESDVAGGKGTGGASALSSSRRSGRKSKTSLPASSEGGATIGAASAAPMVVLNTQLEVPASHISLAELYFSSLCLFAKNTSGQMAKQVATCACASVLQLMFLSGAAKRFEELMEKAVLPMCEMYREALISADKATKAVVLTMIEWMLYQPMAEPCEFTDSALRCGLLDQLDIVSKTTLVVRDKPTRTATLAEKAGALANCIVEKIKERRPSLVRGSRTNAKIDDNAALSGLFLSSTMAKVQRALDELRQCQCSVQGRSVASSGAGGSLHSSSTKQRADTHEKSIRELLRIFDESTNITAYEVFNIGLASTLLYYLLGDRTPEELVGDPVGQASGAAVLTFTSNTGAEPDANTGPLDRKASTWASMMASGMNVADILAMYVVEKRLRCLMECAVAYPTGMRRIISILVANLPLQSQLPLVESVVTYDKVLCKTPLQAHHSLCVIAPLVSLCGEAGRRISAAITSPNNARASAAPASQGDSATVTATATATASAPPSSPAAAGTAPASANSRDASAHQRQGSAAAPPSQAATDQSSSVNAANVARLAKSCCMSGHRLHYMEHYAQVRRCDKCNRTLSSGNNCRVCNFDLCETCYTSYTGNIELIRSLLSMERNRVHLGVTIGDLERWFRTGSTSTKGTQLAPTSQSSLHHLERFTTRVLTFLKRYSATADTGAFLPIPRMGGGGGSGTSASAAFIAHANPAAGTQQPLELVEKLLGHPEVVRRLTHKYLSRFATREPLMDEAVPITMDHAAVLDAMVVSLLPTLAEQRAADELVKEAVEERYVLYRTSCGMLPYQETMLSTLYRRAFALGDLQVLLQLENCLLRLEGAADEPLTLQANSTVTVANPAASATRRSLNTKVMKKVKSVMSPLTGAGAGAFPGSASAAVAAAASAGLPATSSIEKSADVGEFDGHHVALDQTYHFHHFESDAAASCSCGAHTRAEFHTEEPPALTFTAPDFAHRADMLLLIMLHRALFEETHGRIAYAAEASKIFGNEGDSIFENHTITTTVVRSLEASALRVSILPPCYALPRWVNFLLREGRFLIPLTVRARVSRFLAYGARRAFIEHMRVFRGQRNDRAVSILPGEWAKLSNHKFTISRDTFVRDAYTMLRKCSDARFAISVEFSGDVGVGQGPTAQFYTLLAMEASKRTAGLWRVDGERANGFSFGAASPLSPGKAVTVVTAPLAIGPPPTSLPPRRSNVTPTASPSHRSASRPSSVTPRMGNVTRPPSISVSAIPTPSSSQAFAAVDTAYVVPPSAGVSANPSFATKPCDDAMLVPPVEGFYPRHLNGVRRYLDDIESIPTTPMLRRSHSRNLRDDYPPLATSQGGAGSLGGSGARKAGSAFFGEQPQATGGATLSGAYQSATGNSMGYSAVQYDLTKAALLVDSNVGLMRDFVLEQRERAKAYYVIGAALGRAFLDEQVFPLPLSLALAYFIRRGVPAYQCALCDVTQIDPPPEFPIDLFELPVTAASWVDQSVAQSLDMLASLDSATLAALELPFTLPGDDSFELLPGGSQMTVTKKNLRLYQRRVVGALLYESVAVPLYFLTMGCRDVVPQEALAVLDVKELIGVLCGDNRASNEPLWTKEEIRSVLVGDHGYHHDSPQLELLATVLANRLTPAEQREFLLFCTGCPRLPLGGIRALGAITVVKRSNAFAEARTAAMRAEASAVAESDANGDSGHLDMEGDEEEDGSPLGGLYEPTAPSDVEETSSGWHETPRRLLSSVGRATSEEPGLAAVAYAIELPESEWALPSVNTCFRYLKLPPYPSEELLYRKLRMSITQSGGSFELS